MTQNSSKGSSAEEVLRNYFISIGYFVIRGCKFRFDGSDVTDVDLWLYGKKSAVTRERINVDIKNKKTPQALERIFWAKGLQEVLGLDGCVVATTDDRFTVKQFGLMNAVTVLDGKFTKRLMNSSRAEKFGINEEELLSAVNQGSLGKVGGDWQGRYESGKSRMLDSLSFDGCNAWLNDISDYLEFAIQDPSGADVSWRLFYLSIAKFLISVDFILSKHFSADHDERRDILEDGFRYGSLGKAYAEKVGRLASSLVHSVVRDPGLGESVRRALGDQAANIRADILAEHLSKGIVSGNLFDLAREFDWAGFEERIPFAGALSSNAQSMIGVISDFLGFDRKRVFKGDDRVINP